MNMGIATLLKAAEYIERRDRGEKLLGEKFLFFKESSGFVDLGYQVVGKRQYCSGLQSVMIRN